MIFDEEFGVMSGSFGLVNAPCARAVKAFAEWQAGTLERIGGGVKVLSMTADLRTCFDALLPTVVPVPMKHIFVPTAGSWTLFANNFRRGTDAHSPMIMLSKFLETAAIRVVAREQRIDRETHKITQYGATILEYYSNGDTQRSIACTNDGGRWRFEAFGDPFKFENLAQYEARSIKERFNKKMLLDYLMRLDVGQFDDDLFIPGPDNPAYIVQRTGTLPQGYQEFGPKKVLN